jgi:hypothetical protein
MDLCKASKVGTLVIPDWAKALVVAVLSAPVGLILDTLNTGTLAFDWKKVVVAALTGGIGYLAKNFLTGSGGQLLTNKSKEGVQVEKKG